MINERNMALPTHDPLVSSARTSVKITAIKAMQLGDLRTLIKIETDAGISGYGECHGSGPFAREAIAALEGPRLPHLGLIGKDPLALEVHFHNMFYAYPQRGRVVRVLSGIDIALWDLAGKLLGQPVSKLLGGNFRDEITLYSHCGGGDHLSKAEWRDRAAALKGDPRGFKAFKVDIHHVLGVPMQQFTPSIGPQEARLVHRAYTLAREALGEEIDIIVHCHNELDVPSAIRVAEAVESIQPLFYEDPLAPHFSEAWLALRRTTRLPIMTGENIELPEQALPFLQHGAVDVLQPDLINSGGITGTKRIADLSAQRQRLDSEHGLATVLRGYFQLSAHGMFSAGGPIPVGKSQSAYDQSGQNGGLHGPRLGAGSRPRLSQSAPRRGRTLVGIA